MYNVQLEEFCETYQLGNVVKTTLFPVGMANRTYLVETETDKYVIKAINPAKVKTKDKVKKLEIAEYIAEIANKNGVPSITAKRVDGKIINEFQKQHYIVFDFFDGETLYLNKVTTDHCLAVGRLIGSLHKTKFDQLPSSEIKECNYEKKRKGNFDWQAYLIQIQPFAPSWLELFQDSIPFLDEMFTLSREVRQSFVPKDKVVSHGDISNLNILWQDDIPHLLDWETAGFIDATYECLYAAIRLSCPKKVANCEERYIDMDRVYAVFKGYAEKRKINVQNLDTALYMIFYKRLGILNRNLNNYVVATNEADRKKAERVITSVLALINALKELEESLEDTKKMITEIQNEERKKHKFSLKNFFKKINY